MALWQYTFFVLPGNAIREKGLDFVFPNNHEEFDDTEFWIQRHEKPSLFDQIAGILAKANSWSIACGSLHLGKGGSIIKVL